MKGNIKIIVSNIVEDESGSEGLWDLAREIAYGVLNQIDFEDLDGNIKDKLDSQISTMQEKVYNMLLENAEYTHPEHYSNSDD